MTVPVPSPLPNLALAISALLDCACELLADNGRAVCECCLIHAQDLIPMDNCDCNCPDGRPESAQTGHGRLSARVVQITTAANNSDNGAPSSDCMPSLVTATVDFGVFRCITTTQDGTAVDCDTVTLESLDFIADSAILRQAVLCCPQAAAVKGGWDIVPDYWLPHGPAGGCAGGVLRVEMTGLFTFRPTLATP